MGFSALLEPVIADCELQAGVDARIAIANARVRKMENLAGKSYCALGLEEVVKASATAGHEIETRRAGDREVARCDQEAAGYFGEGRELFPAGEIPFENNWVRPEAIGHPIVSAESAVALEGGVNGNDVRCPLKIAARPAFTHL